MRLDDYDHQDGKRVWLSSDEIDQLVEATNDPQHKIAISLGGKCGMRRSEIISITSNDVIYGPPGFVRIWEDYSKGDKYRECPIPDSLENFILGFKSGKEPDEPIVDVSSTTCWRWVKHAAEKIQADTGDSGWSYVHVHDLRRSWGAHLLWDCGVSPMAVMDWGGWEDWDTFKNHYMGEMSPKAQERERKKVFEEPRSDEIIFEPSSESARDVYSV